MEKDYILLPAVTEAVDVILCRNVLMYFNDQKRNYAIQNLSNFLAEDGWLITTPAESGFIQLPELSPVKFPNAIFHKKRPVRKENGPTFDTGMQKDPDKIQPQPPMPVNNQKNMRPSTHPSSDVIDSDKLDYDVYLRAVKDYEKGDYTQTVTGLSSILSEKISNRSFLIKTDSMVLQARSYANMGKVDKARYWCEKAIDSEKLNPKIYYLLSTIFQAAGNINDSIRTLKQALYLDPEFIMAHFTLGLLLQQENKLHESKKSITNALALLKTKDPDEILTYSDGMTAGLLIDTIVGMTNKN